jgi:hypothetical protein
MNDNTIPKYAESTLRRKTKDQLVELAARYSVDVTGMPEKEMVALILAQQEEADRIQAVPDPETETDEPSAQDGANSRPPAPNIVLAEEDQNEPEVVSPKYAGNPAAWERDRLLVKFFQTDEPGIGKKPISASLNGRAYLIPRDKQVSVPRAVVQLLQDAVITRYEQVEENGQKVMEEREVPRFPCQVFGTDIRKAR